MSTSDQIISSHTNVNLVKSYFSVTYKLFSINKFPHSPILLCFFMYPYPYKTKATRTFTSAVNTNQQTPKSTFAISFAIGFFGVNNNSRISTAS